MATAKIDIKTTQNVTIEYELAPLSERIFAFLIDQVIIWGLITLAFTVFSSFNHSIGGSMIFFLVLIPIFVFYSLFNEVLFNGQSPGKRVFGIKVVKLTGIEPNLNDFLIRWTFRFIDIILSLGTLAILLIGSSSKRQRLGDMLANTAVIRMKSSFHLKLNDILKINSLENYEVTYPGVRQFSEEDMLLIKNVISRCQRFPNEAHQKAMSTLVKTMMEKLGMAEWPKSKIQFLKTLIRDYIVLTR